MKETEHFIIDITFINRKYKTQMYMLKHHIIKYHYSVINLMKYMVKLKILRNGYLKMNNFIIWFKIGTFLFLNM